MEREILRKLLILTIVLTIVVVGRDLSPLCVEKAPQDVRESENGALH
jgi:hypothetical protein